MRRLSDSRLAVVRSLLPAFVALTSLSACGGTVVFEEPGDGGAGPGDGDGDGGRSTPTTATSSRASSSTGFSTSTGSDTCPPDTVYACDGGTTCLSQLDICDGFPDCSDGTDEFECTSGCTKEEFICSDGSCIPFSWVCDFVGDCPAGEDESPDVCGFVDCQPGDLPCRDGSCIPDVYVCDGGADCSDSGDETSDVCNGFVCGYPEIATEDPPFAYCLTYYCCSAFDQCVALGGVDGCLECLNEGDEECSPVLDCIVDNCAD